MTAITIGNTRAVLAVDNPNWLADSINRYDLNKRRNEILAMDVDKRALYSEEFISITAEIDRLNKRLGNKI